MLVIYKFIEDFKPKERIFTDSGEAVDTAVRDMESSRIRPVEVLQVLMDREAIEAEFERRTAA
jgi:hypothetical protein